jgi:signal transduction histidine kinase
VAATRSWKTLAAVTTLAALGVAGNVFGVPFGYTVTLLFGSIFAIIALSLLGATAGLVVSTLAASYTYVLWNHPYAIAIFVAETAFMAVALRRGQRHLVFVDSVYWLTCGAPLVVLFYHFAMGVDAQGTAIIVLKQSVNGVTNALVASILLDHVPLGRWLGPRVEPRGIPTADVLFQVVASVLTVPSLLVIALGNVRERTDRQAATAHELAADAREVRALVDAWVLRHFRAVHALADAGRRADLRPAPELQAELARLRGLFPDFHNVYVADASARTVGFDPPINTRGEATVGLDFSDRPYFAELVRTRAPGVSEVFMGRGGVFAPIFSLTVPIVEGPTLRGYGLGAVDVDRLAVELARHETSGGATATLVDARGRVIASTSAERRPLDPVVELATQPVDPALGVSLHVPGARALVSSMEVWKGAFYVTRTPVEGTPWTLRMERPVAPLQRALYASTSQSLVLVAGLYGLALAVAGAVSRKLSGAPRLLAAISRDLPARIEDGREPEWPTSRVAEMIALVRNFQAMADALRERIAAIKAANFELEDRVAARTRELVQKTVELEALTSGLERRVADEVAARRRNEHLLAQQSKLAAMGEMLGAIAHQWRQPLNALGLIVQNLREEIEAGPASAGAHVDRTVDRAMAQIRSMSKTIEDFRSFFAPDREETTFDVALAAVSVKRLVAAQLASAAIALRVERVDGDTRTKPDEASPRADHAVRARRNELEHVVHNLVNNAREAILERRAAGRGGGAITIEVRAEADRVRMEVRDDGGGIDPAILERIFEPYFTTKPATGTGIGLYVSRLILEDHCRARLSVRNEGEGAVFTVDLPRAAG